MKKKMRALQGITSGLFAMGITLSATTSHAADRPINIVAFGDSVMWGQGLAEQEKFRTIVKNHIHSFTPNRDVRLFNFSRSGAKIEPRPVNGKGHLPMLPLTDPPGAPIQSDDPANLWGEVPWQLPSITKQYSAPQLPVTDSEVDLILLNGGADDIGLTPASGPTSILSMDMTWPIDSSPPADVNAPGSAGTVHKWIYDNGPDRMSRLLPAITAKYRNATVVVAATSRPIRTRAARRTWPTSSARLDMSVASRSRRRVLRYADVGRRHRSSSTT